MVMQVDHVHWSVLLLTVRFSDPFSGFWTCSTAAGVGPRQFISTQVDKVELLLSFLFFFFQVTDQE